MRPECQALIAVLHDTRALLERAENDFSWSWWSDATAALQEVNSLIAGVEAGRRLRHADVVILYLPARTDSRSEPEQWLG